MRQAALLAALPVLGLALPACGARSGLLVFLEESEQSAQEGELGEDPVLDAPERVPTAIPIDPEQARADRVDLLFVIDDSGSMADKQQILRKALPDLVSRLINPLCVDPSTLEPVDRQPDTPFQNCPGGALREFNSVQDFHIGVITSDLGLAGAGCRVTGSDAESDRALLQANGAATYDDRGFVAWDPAATKTPPGERDPSRLLETLSTMVEVGESGCPLEMPLEAMYQFLVAPDPFERIAVGGCAPGSGFRECARLDGTNDALLEQRRDFLRYDSLVAIVLLSDENDCSLAPGPMSHRIVDAPGTFPRATSACSTDPNDPCCQSCEAPPAAGCRSLALDPECSKGPYGAGEDSIFLRCFDQKRRFGVNLHHDPERYVTGLTSLEVPNRNGVLVPNPLFVDPEGNAPPRDPSLVFFATLVGVPWQDIAVDHTDTEELVFKSTSQMEDDGTWDIIVGDPDAGRAPLDPLMIESIDERTGRNPVTGDLLAPSTSTDPLANPINGHEMDLTAGGFELQYACIFDLPAPVVSSDCSGPILGTRPICQNARGEYGSIQFRAKAYPGIRHLEVARNVGQNAIVGSICARNVVDNRRSDFGYRPALSAILDRLRVGLN